MVEQALKDRRIYDRFYAAANHLAAVVGIDSRVVLSYQEGKKVDQAVAAVRQLYGENIINDKRVTTIAAIALCDATEFIPQDTSLEGGNYPND